MIMAGPLIATCPTHGEQPFKRCHPCKWWYCPATDVCKSVIPDEDVTPDGADVIQWNSTSPNYYCGALH